MFTTLQQLHDHATPGSTITVTELGYDLNGRSISQGFPDGKILNTIQYNASTVAIPFVAPAPPIVALYHEMAHTEDAFAHTQDYGDYKRPDRRHRRDWRHRLDWRHRSNWCDG